MRLLVSLFTLFACLLFLLVVPAVFRWLMSTLAQLWGVMLISSGALVYILLTDSISLLTYLLACLCVCVSLCVCVCARAHMLNTCIIVFVSMDWEGERPTEEMANNHEIEKLGVMIASCVTSVCVCVSVILSRSEVSMAAKLEILSGCFIMNHVLYLCSVNLWLYVSFQASRAPDQCIEDHGVRYSLETLMLNISHNVYSQAVQIGSVCCQNLAWEPWRAIVWNVTIFWQKPAKLCDFGVTSVVEGK